MAETYRDRDELVQELGFKSYGDYLRSATWLRIRALVLRVYRFRCGVCRGRAKDVHHIRYTRAALLGEDRAQLVPLCGKCHILVEFDHADGKRTLADSQKAYSRLKRGVCLRCGKPTGGPRYRYCRACFMKQKRPRRTP